MTGQVELVLHLNFAVYSHRDRGYEGVELVRTSVCMGVRGSERRSS